MRRVRECAEHGARGKPGRATHCLEEQIHLRDDGEIFEDLEEQKQRSDGAEVLHLLQLEHQRLQVDIVFVLPEGVNPRSNVESVIEDLSSAGTQSQGISCRAPQRCCPRESANPTRGRAGGTAAIQQDNVCGGVTSGRKASGAHVDTQEDDCERQQGDDPIDNIPLVAPISAQRARSTRPAKLT